MINLDIDDSEFDGMYQPDEPELSRFKVQLLKDMTVSDVHVKSPNWKGRRKKRGMVTFKEAVEKYNPNHDPRTGQFTGGAGGVVPGGTFRGAGRSGKKPSKSHRAGQPKKLVGRQAVLDEITRIELIYDKHFGIDGKGGSNKLRSKLRQKVDDLQAILARGKKRYDIEEGTRRADEDTGDWNS